jgi:hypothetical protein
MFKYILSEFRLQISFIFDKLNETRLINNLHVLLLEEDHYLLPDSIHVLRKLSEKYFVQLLKINVRN